MRTGSKSKTRWTGVLLGKIEGGCEFRCCPLEEESVIFPPMVNEHDGDTPVWVEGSALAAPVILGASAGLLMGDLMHKSARRGMGLGLGVLGVVALLPFAVDGITGLITGPRSKFGVRRKIQKIRDIGIGTPVHDGVDEELREAGVI